LYIDPPWKQVGAVGYNLPRSAVKYATMSQKELLALAQSVRRITSSRAHCYMWTTNRELPRALELISAYGFEYITTITWDKGKNALGTYFRSRTEHCLFATTKARSVRVSCRDSTMLTAPRGIHSEKPSAMREMIERVSYPPYLELFARRALKNWNAIGLELEDV
jgi:N6-adenosine-specific RNA methylase IME4